MQHGGSAGFRETEPDRRSIVVGLAALVALPAVPQSSLAASDRSSWILATQIVAGTRVSDPNALSLAVDTLEAEVGAEVVRRLCAAILARDAADIVEPFEDPAIESAARRFVEMVYTGEITPGATVGYHQALAWQVLPFTKPPSVCGPGMGWWADRPERG